MTLLHVEYESSESGGHPLSNDRWCDYSDRIITFSPTAIFIDRKDKNSWRNEDVESDEDVNSGDTVFLVVVRYSDGDTFSHSYGNYSFWGVYNDVEKAKKLKALINQDNKNQDSLRDIPYRNKKAAAKWKKESDNLESEIKKLATGKYVSLYNWRGYFNSLENVEIHIMTVI